MKHTLQLPSFMAPAPQAFADGDPRSMHPPFFTTSMVLSPLVWPLGVVMGLLYLCAPKWRSAGGVMLGLAVTAGVLGWLVFLSIR